MARARFSRRGRSRIVAIVCSCLVWAPLLSCVSASFEVGGHKVRARIPAAVAGALAKKLIETERFFTRRRAKLRVVEEGPAQPPAYLEKEVLELLEDAERRVAGDLEDRKLLALADFFRAELEDARRGLARGRTASAAARSAIRLAAWTPGDAYAPAPRLASSRAKTLVARSSADPILDRWLDYLRRVIGQADDDDLVLDLCVETLPDKATLRLYPRYRYPAHERSLLTNNVLANVDRGAYVYHLHRDGYPEIRCLYDDSRPSPVCRRLDLVNFDRPLVKCVLDPASGPLGCDVREEPEEGWTCGGGPS